MAQGVHVFFICSGIGLYISYLKKKVNYISFIKKRFYKIYIPYIIVIIISFFLPWIRVEKSRPVALLSHIFLFKMFIPQYESSFGMQFWFISTIIQLYFLFIPMCIFKEKLNNNKFFFSIFMSLSISWWIICYFLHVADNRVWNSFFLQYIWEFALGFIIAEKFYQGHIFKISKNYLFFIAILGIGLQATLAIISDSLKLFNDIPAVLGYSSLALWFMEFNIIKYFFQKISTFSYELFLVHILVIDTLFQFIKPETLVTQILTSILALFLSMFVGFEYNIFCKKFIYKVK